MLPSAAPRRCRWPRHRTATAAPNGIAARKRRRRSVSWVAVSDTLEPYRVPSPPRLRRGVARRGLGGPARATAPSRPSRLWRQWRRNRRHRIAIRRRRSSRDCRRIRTAVVGRRRRGRCTSAGRSRRRRRNGPGLRRARPRTCRRPRRSMARRSRMARPRLGLQANDPASVANLVSAVLFPVRRSVRSPMAQPHRDRRRRALPGTRRRCRTACRPASRTAARSPGGGSSPSTAASGTGCCPRPAAPRR